MPNPISDDQLAKLVSGFSNPSSLAVCQVHRNEPTGERIEAAPRESDAVRLALTELLDRRNGNW